MKGLVGRPYLNAYLPVSTHTQVAFPAEVSLAIGEQIDAVSPHVHVEHGGVERYADVRRDLARAGINHRYREEVRPEVVGVDVERHGELLVRGHDCPVQW